MKIFIGLSWLKKNYGGLILYLNLWYRGSFENSTGVPNFIQNCS